MNREQMGEISDALSGAYRFMDFSGPATFETWFEILKGYEFAEVKQAVRTWIAYNKTEPTPADILDGTKNVRLNNRKIAQESVAWSETVRCPKCNDRGFVLVIYPGGHEELRPCDCAAARENFGYCFTEEYDRKAEAILRREQDPDVAWSHTCYKYGLEFRDADEAKRTRETWKRRKFSEIRKVERSGQVVIMVEEVKR